MINILEKLVTRLLKVNHTIASKQKVNEVAFEDALVAAQFFHDFQNTNKVIDVVEEMAHQNVEALVEYSAKLKKLIDMFMSMDFDAWEEVNYMELADKHLASYKCQWDAAKDKATELWNKYQSESNRLDFMDMQSEEYKELDAQCDQSHLLYNEAHKYGDELYQIYKSEQKKCILVYYFEMPFLELWGAKMSKIINAVLKDVDWLKKEANT